MRFLYYIEYPSYSSDPWSKPLTWFSLIRRVSVGSTEGSLSGQSYGDIRGENGEEQLGRHIIDVTRKILN